MKKPIKSLLVMSLALVLTFSNVASLNAKEKNVLLDNGVSVTMSSSAMNPVSTKKTTDQSERDQSWYHADQQNVTYRTSKVDSIDLIKSENNNLTISIDDKTTYQKFSGIGTSLEHSTIYNLLQLSENKRREVIRYMIDPKDGLGLSMFRLTIGTSDFKQDDIPFYSYYDTENNIVPEKLDWYNKTGQGFSIQPDIDTGVIGVLQMLMEEAKMLGIEDEIHFFGDSWSLPGWMKTDKTAGLFGNKLDNKHVDDAAMYYVRWIEEYSKLGIPIYGTSLQNQSLLGLIMPPINGLPTCGITAVQEAKIAEKIKVYLKDSDILTEAQKDIKVWCLCYSWQEAGADKYAREVFENDVSKSIDGTSFHDYRANPIYEGLNEMSKYGQVLVAERSLWGTYGMNRILNYYRNNTISYTSWVTMLGKNYEGKGIIANPGPTLMIRDTSSDNQIRYMPEAHMIGQFGKIRPGYVRVQSTDTIADAEFGMSNVVFKDPNTGKLVMVVVNNSNENQIFVAGNNEYSFRSTVPATTVATYIWNPNDIDVEAPVIEGKDAIVTVGTKETVEKILELKVIDDKDGNISLNSENIVIETDFDSSKIRNYTVKVIASDKVGNVSEKTFTITVKEKMIQTDIDSENDNNQIKNDISDSEQSKQTVATNDNTNPYVWIIGGTISMICIGYIMFKKKKDALGS